MRENIAPEVLRVPNTCVKGESQISLFHSFSTSEAKFEAVTEWIQEVEVVLERSRAVVWFYSNRFVRNFFIAEISGSERVRVFV